MVSKQEDERERMEKQQEKKIRKMKNAKSTHERKQTPDDVVANLMTKNQDRLKYFRQTTPLDATRSMKMGLQKIEDLLDQTERLNFPRSRNNNRQQKRDKSID